MSEVEELELHQHLRPVGLAVGVQAARAEFQLRWWPAIHQATPACSVFWSGVAALAKFRAWYCTNGVNR